MNMKIKRHDILVLNKNYVPIHIIGWQKCMSLIIQEAARPLDRDFVTYSMEDWMKFSTETEDYHKIHTSKQGIALPEVITLRKYDRLPIRDVKYSRQTLFQRDKFHCAYCMQVFPRDQLTVDHIMPRSKGGHSTWANTVSCCKPCNNFKADRTPDEAKMKLHLKPKKPVWLSPVADLKPDHPCKSWLKFMDRTPTD